MNDVDNNKIENSVVECIVRSVGERVIISGGRDYVSPTVRIIESTYSDAGDNEKAIFISQKDTGGISLSLATLETILNWAKQKENYGK